MAHHGASENGTNRLLKGWKEIAVFFGRDERTVRRWASATDFPVHRVPGRQRAAVYAYSADLDAWLTSQRRPETSDETTPAASLPPPASRRYRFDRPAPALVALVLAASVVILGWRLGLETRATESHQPSEHVQDLYLDGIYNLETRTADGIDRAIGLFTEATTLDQDYAKAFVGLADAYNLVSQYTSAPASEAYPKARAAAERAVALDAREPGAYAALAFNTYYWRRDFTGSMALFEKSIALDPNNARAHHWYALVAMQNRRFDIALREITVAQRLSPETPAIVANKGLILFHAGHVEEALAILKPLAVTEPAMLSPPAYLATIYLATGLDRDFLREFRRAGEVSRNTTDLALADAAEAGFDRGGRPEMLAAMFAEQKRLYAADRLPAFKLALTAAMLGENAAALDYLDASIQRKEPDILGIRLEPALAGLRKDNRFNLLVAEAGLSPDATQ